MPPREADVFENCACAFLSMNTWLSHQYHSQGVFVTHTTIKYNCLIHLALEARDLHPNHGWCFGGESFMNFIKRFVLIDARCTQSDKVAGKVARAWLYAMRAHFDPDSMLL